MEQLLRKTFDCKIGKRWRWCIAGCLYVCLLGADLCLTARDNDMVRRGALQNSRGDGVVRCEAHLTRFGVAR